MKKIFALSILFFLSINLIFSQNDSLKSRSGALKVYINGDCDMQYIKKNLNYVNYVIDLHDADVTITKTAQDAGNGGEKISLIFEGRKKFLNKNDTLSYSTMADATSDDKRRLMLKYLKIGLMQYVAHTPMCKDLDINYTKQTQTIVKEDKWNSWVVQINSQAFVNAESSYKHISISSSANINRITDKWKLKFTLRNSFNESQYIYGQDTTKSFRRNYEFNNKIVKSIGNHWAIGEFSEVGSSTYSNEKMYVRFSPAIEYDLFPYSKSNISQLRVQLSVGPNYYQYNDTTIYNKIKELVWQQKIAVVYQINKPWGKINIFTGYRSLLNDMNKYSISTGMSIDVRLFKGFSIFAQGNYYIVRDQINLAKGNLSYADVLLRQQEIATDYTYWGIVGISYTFGSIYNNVVNPRLDDIF